MKFITLGKLMDILQSYKDNFGEDIPVLLSDKNSPDSLTNLIGAYVIDIVDQETDESQEVILLCNMEEDELTSDPGFDFSDDEEKESDEVFHEDDSKVSLSHSQTC